MTQPVEISVVVCTFNRAAMLRRALESLLSQTTPPEVRYEIVVIDDGSTDDTPPVVAELAEGSAHVPVRYFRQEGTGIAGARNHGIRRAQGEWIAFFDDDQWADPLWLMGHYTVANEKGADCTGGSMVLDLPPDAEDQRLTRLVRSLLDERLPAALPIEYPRNTTPGTGNVMVRRAILQRLGGFDEQILESGSDSDLFWRARAEGASIWLAPAALAHHVISRRRLSEEHLGYVALRVGMCAARVRWKHVGWLRWFLALVYTVVRSTTVDTAAWCVGTLAGRPWQRQDARLRWLGTVGYVRRSLMILAPRLFRQTAFRQRINFRNRHVPS